MRAKGEGFFARADTLPYEPAGVLVGQIHEDSCVAACCRMWLWDQGVEESEAVIRAVLGTRGLGTNLAQVPAAMRQLGSVAQYEFKLDMTLADLQQALSASSVLVFLKQWPQARDGHALLVEAVEDKGVAVRDPWPPGYGAAYRVKLESFLRCWLLPDSSAGGQSGRAVVIK